MMASVNIFNKKGVLECLKNEMNEELIKVAQPAIDEALAKIEKDIKRKLGSMVIGLLDNYMEVESDRQTLRIVIKKEN